MRVGVAAIVRGNLFLTDGAPATYSVDYVSFTRSYDTLHFQNNFDYWLTEIVFEQRF